MTEKEKALKKSRVKAAVIDQLSSIYGRIDLNCDGYLVALTVERVTAMTYRVMTYVNGEFKGVWTFSEKPCPEQKFLNKKVQKVYSRNKLKRLEAVCGKRYMKTHVNPEYVYYAPDWASAKTAINHLLKVCDSVEVVSK